MMSIDIVKCNDEIEKIHQIDKALGRMQFKLDFFRICGLLWNPTGMEQTLKEISAKIEEEQQALKNLQNGMGLISKKYIHSEMVIKDYFSSNANNSNIAFDDSGRYGGDQGAPQNISKNDEQYDKIVEIIKRYFPDYNDKEIKKLLKRLNSEGCGYVALINTLFNEFVGKEEKFEKIFGFPMYDENGDLNFDLLLVDFYSAKDDPQHSGTNRESRKELWESYMEEHGIDVDVQNIDVTPENYERIAQKGEVIVSVSPVVLYDENGNRVVDVDGGHAMTVTGVTEDGMYRVSSWGKEYYVNPNEQYDRLQFQQVRY